MLYFGILKCEVEKKERHLMLYFVILKCEVDKKGIALPPVSYDTASKREGSLQKSDGWKRAAFRVPEGLRAAG